MTDDAPAGLRSLLNPRSVAIIGASEDIRTYAGAPVHNLLAHGFTGRVYPVNPRRTEVQGVPCFPSVLDVPGPVDTAVIAVPTAAVTGVLEECVRKGAASATIITSGFGEEAAGPAGQERAAELEALIARTGIRVLGPNTAGLVNLADAYVPRAAYNQFDPDRVRSGPVALVTQSGACGNIVFNRAQAHGVGVGLSVATGDQIDVDIWELCRFAVEDPRFLVVMVVAETLGDAGRFERLARDANAAGKLLAVLKLGRSELGRRAVMTHSGSLAGDAAVQSAAMRQLGVVEVDDLDDLWQLARLVEAWGPPTPEPGRLGVVSFSGGEGAMIADRCAEHGLALPPTSPAFAEVISANFAYAMASNPFDPSGEIIGRPEKVALALGAFMERNDFTEVLIATPVLRAEQAERQLGDLRQALDGVPARVCLSHWEAGDLTRTQERILVETGRPVFQGSGTAIRAIALYHRAGARRRDVELPQHDGREPGALAPDARYLDVRAELAQLGVAFPPAVLARSAAEAAARASEVGLPLVMKANVTSSVHKLANGLLALDVDAAERAAERFGALAAAGERFAADGVVLEARGRGHVEVMVGAHRDPDLGGCLLFGSGGTGVEHLGDTALGIARYTDAAEAERIVLATRAGRLLAERAPAAVAELARMLAAVGAWFAANPQLAALDLNPLLVDLDGGRVICVDARVA